MLALSLQKLSQATVPKSTDSATNLDVRIFADTTADLEAVEYCRDKFYPEALIFQASAHVQSPSGCWNILHSIKQGYETGADYIFMLEEDVMVRQNFFEHHLSSFSPERPDILASCGRRDRGHYPVYGPLYTNPGSCLSRRLVAELIPHINDSYFTELRQYMDRELPPNWDEQSNLDDGLIRRVIRKMGGVCAYPEPGPGVCAHQGWGFYNKIDIYMNDEVGIENRIARLQELMRSLKPGDRYAKDFEPF
jgi:hypothetical protein